MLGGPEDRLDRSHMSDGLTESFCERCGTRYEFEPPKKMNPVRRTRGMVSGLRHFIMSQDSLGDSIGEAMRSEEQALAAGQLEAFHGTFTFCIDCRQYACLKCWNTDAGRCRSCAPVAGQDDLIQRLETAVAETAAEGAEAWPSAEPLEAAAPFLATDGEVSPAWPAAEIIVPAEPEPEPVVELEPEPVPIIPVAPEPEPVVAAAWEDDVAWELMPDQEPAVAETAVEPQPVVAVEPEPQPVAAIEPPIELPLPEAPELAARRAQLAELGLGDPGQGPVEERPKVVPYRSSGAPARAAERAAARAAAVATEAMWAASSREVAAAASAIGVRDCAGCGLSLSASARFCRRCGAPQAKSA